MHGKTKNPKDLPDENQGTKKHLSLTLGYPSERERGEMRGYPGPWEEAPEEMAGLGGDSGGRREDEQRWRRWT
jgi:hypothetical protein